MNSPVFRAPSRWMWGTLTMAAFLAGCGGGDDPIPAASLSGVAAVGAPITNGTVAVQCAGGAALNTTTNTTTGAWQVFFAGQTLPCAVQVSGGTISGSTNTTLYHSIALSLGTVNVTPLTDLIVAQLAGANPQTWFGSPVFTNVNTGAVQTALNNVASGLGIASTLGSVDPITTAFKAAPGDAVDKLLEALKTALTNTSQTYAALLSAAQTGSYSAFTGFGTAFSTAAQGGSTTPPGTVGPVRAANCPSVATTLVPACPAGTAASLAQLTAITGTYDNLFITNRGTAYYGASPNEYTPTSMCAAGDDVVLNFTTGVRLAFVISSTSVTVDGNAPTSPATPMNSVPQSSCQY